MLLFAGFSACQAISTTRINAGGIYPDQSVSEVVSIYGQPVSVEKEEVRAGFRHTNVTYKYGRFGTTFNVTFIGNRVSHITVAGNNGIATSDGIKVGTPLSEIKKLFGRPRVEEPRKDGTTFVLYVQDEYRDPQRRLYFFIRNNKVEAYSVDAGYE